MRLSLIAAVLAVSSGAAVADPMSVGFRLGGYGFRREGASAQSSDAWTLCRMNGLGVFAHRTVRGPLFLEAGLDTYYSANQYETGDLPIDRQSGIVTVAAGLRTNFTSWLGGFLQLGTGAELTRVSVPYGDGTISDSKVMPTGFFGFGADVHYGKTHLGAQVRTLVMGNFDYDPQRLEMTGQWSQPTANQVFDASPSLASQGQIYLRRDL